jgi:nitrogen fixation/metabolism regulation signal transduction histidine kinase
MAWPASRRPDAPGPARARPSPVDLRLDAALASVVEGAARQRQVAGAYQDLLRSETLLTLLLLGLVLALLALWFSRALARQLAAPLAELVHGTERIAAGDLEHRVTVKARDELGELVAAFNRMGAQLAESRERRLRAERLAAWQGIARRLAHEIKNPLTPITLAMHRIERRSEDPAVRESIAAVLEEAGNLQRLADEFSLFARLPAPVPAPLELRGLLAGVLELYLAAERYPVRWEGWPQALPLVADPGQLRQLLANLVKNAAEAMGEAGTLTLRYRAEGGGHCLDIEDEGPGFAGDPEAVFEPHVTSKAAGTGLGLAIARRIAEDHGGRLRAANLPTGGARLTLELPAARAGDGGEGGGEHA